MPSWNFDTLRCRVVAMGVAGVLVALALTDIRSAAAGTVEGAAAAYRKRDFAVALSLWQPLAEQGNPAAQTGLGILYENGWGVSRDRAKAVDWFRRAAEQRDAEAEYRLGEMYVYGPSGFPRDLSQGLSLMVKAADQGNVHSQRALGDLYHSGSFGVPTDLAQSFAWYKRAADLGDALAEQRVATAYEFGDGVVKDPEEGKLWRGGGHRTVAERRRARRRLR